MPAWGAWDHDTYAAATQILTETPRPFLGLVFTASTHSPFQWPERFAPAVSGLGRFETSVQYADQALGQFLDSAAAAGLLANTLLVVTADHVAKSGSQASGPLAAHQIPFLLAGPMVPAGSESHAICSQLDLLPTLIDLLDWPVEHATFGRSLLAPPTPAHPRGALLVRGRLLGRVEQAGWLLHDGNRRVATSSGATDATIDAIEQRLLATVQVATRSLLHNRVARPP
jgi:phosphoglycerol transferase MdoB-like AlkP superfamily enzyme